MIQSHKVFRSQLQHFEEGNGGTLKHSLANLVYIHRPLLIVDEAHNARTPLTFETLQRLNPSCIVEFTATPLIHGSDRSNILFNVSASTLKNEDMIKMPIELDVSEEWHIVIQNAVKKQRDLNYYCIRGRKKDWRIYPSDSFVAIRTRLSRSFVNKR